MTHQEYQEKRNALIPLAVAFANKKEGRRSDNPWEGPHMFAKRWNLCFLTEMDRLAEKEGLTVPFKTIPPP